MFEELFHAKGQIGMHRQRMRTSSLSGLVSTATIDPHGHPIRCRTIIKGACTSTMELGMNSLSGTSSESRYLWLMKPVTDLSRQDPAVVSAFAEIWGTEKLLASYGEQPSIS